MNKKVVSMLLGVIMLLNIITTPLSAMEGDLQDIDGLSPSYSIEYLAQTNWGNSQTAQIKITNTGTEDIEGWSLNFEADGEISGLWGATVKTHEENIYILEASPYSAVIKPNTCTTIGYTYVSENSDKPRNMVLLSERVPVSGEYEVKIDKVGGWDKEATLQLVISNKSEYPIRLWDISFNASFNILEVWGGKLVESDTESGNYKIKYSDNTQTIQPNSSVAVGMRCNNVTEPIISNIELSEINNDLNRDIDKDGVTDRDEATFGTDPLKPDTDGDGLSDFEELYITYTEPTKADTDDTGITDDKKDLDEDGLTNLQEINLKTNPILDDTDFDDLKDGEETNKYKTDPLKFDTDGDKIGDGDEIAIGLDPLNASTHGKPDNEYTFEQTVDGEAVSNVNNDSYNLSIDIKAAGNAESSMIVDKSGYTNVISNDAIVGTVPEIIYDENLSVDSFKINFNINSKLVYDGNDDTYSSDEFKGIKKYNVFRYFEDMNMLLPIETTHNEETNTISAETDRTGVYCLINMVKWVKMLGYDPAVTAETTIEEIPQIQMFSDVPGSSDISDDETDRYSCAKALPEDFFAGEFDNIEPQTNGLKARAAVNKDVLDVVFVVYPHTGTACNVMSKQILRMAFAIFNESSNARIYIINPKGILLVRLTAVAMLLTILKLPQ